MSFLWISSVSMPSIIFWSSSFHSHHVRSLLICTGGYFHGINNLTYGVDMYQIRWMGILQVCIKICFLSFLLLNTFIILYIKSSLFNFFWLPIVRKLFSLCTFYSIFEASGLYILSFLFFIFLTENRNSIFSGSSMWNLA